MFAFAAVSKNQGPLVSLMQVGNYGRAARCGDISLPTLNRAPLATVLQCYSATVLQCYSATVSSKQGRWSLVFVIVGVKYPYYLDN